MQRTDSKLLRVIVASPGDTIAERKAMPGVIDEINRDLRGSGLQLELAMWETDAYPGFHPDGPQGIIDAVLKIEQADILIGIFWKRFGKPVKDAASGTEHEVRKAYAAWQQNARPQVMVYFCERAYAPKTQEETVQWGKVLKFKEDFPKEGLWWTFKTTEDFEKLVHNQLKAYLRDKHPRRLELAQPQAPVAVNLPPVSPGTKQTVDYSQPGKVIITSEYLDGLPTTPNPARRSLFERARKLDSKSQFREAIPLFKELLEQPAAPSEELALLILAGNCFGNLSQFDEAQEYYAEALLKAKRLGSEEGEAAALCNMGIVYYGRGDVGSAARYFRKALKMHLALGDTLGQAADIGNLGTVYCHMGQLHRALRYYRRSLRLERRMLNPLGQAGDHANLGEVYHTMADLTRASEHFRAALKIYEEVGSVQDQARQIGNLGVVWMDKGRWGRAVKHFQKALEMYIGLGDSSGQASQLGNLGLACMEQGRINDALVHFQKSLEMHKRTFDLLGQANQLGNIGTVYYVGRCFERALGYHRAALKIHRKIHNLLGEARDLGNLGAVYYSKREFNRALEYHRKSLALLQTIGAKSEMETVKSNIADAERMSAEKR